MRNKTRKYALYQFLSIFAFLIGLGGILLYIYVSPNREVVSIHYLKIVLTNIFNLDFDKNTQLAGGVLVFISIAMQVIALIIGWSVYTTENRNYYDALFLLFLFIPIVSNIFALFAQLAINVSVYKSTRISSKDLRKATSDIKKEIIKLKKSNALKAEK